MSPSVIWAACGALFGLVTAICGVVALILSWQEGNAKDEAAKVEADKSRLAIATANQRAAEANLKATELRRTLGDRYITNEEAEAFVAAAKSLPKPTLIRVVPESFQDRDADAYSRQIQAMLERAGYKCEHILPGEWDTVTGSFSLYTERSFPIPQSNRLESTNHGPWSYQLYDLFRATLGVYIMPGSARFPKITPPDGGIIVIGRKPDVELPPP